MYLKGKDFKKGIKYILLTHMAGYKEGTSFHLTEIEKHKDGSVSLAFFPQKSLLGKGKGHAIRVHVEPGRELRYFWPEKDKKNMPKYEPFIPQNAKTKPCKACNGKGFVEYESRYDPYETETCDSCNGQGKIVIK